MAGLQSCSDISDVKPFYPKRHLYLKPLLKINISIQLPSLKLVGKSISNVTLMEHIRNWASPDKFCAVKVTKSTLEFIRFEADLLNPSKVQAILARLDGKQVTLPGFKETVKVRASIAKSDFPTRHDWDSYFRDAKHMNEMKAGERPDTLHLSDLPNKWFSTKSKEDLPSESLLKKIFQQFGEVTAVDIPSVDPYRSKMKAHLSGLKLFNFNQNTTFEAYVQYRDYISFVKAMDYLRGMKLLRIESDNAFTTNIKVDFDKTKHLSENSIRKRKIEREKLMAKDRELEEKKQKLEDALKKLDETKEVKDSEIEPELIRKEQKQEKSKKRSLRDCCCGDKSEESAKIMNEKKLLLAAQRKLESIRILTELLRLIKERKESSKVGISSDGDIIRKNPESKDYIEDNLNSVKPKLEEKVVSNLTKKDDDHLDEGSRLHSEVVKVDHTNLDYRSRKNYVQNFSYSKGNGLSFDSRRWKRHRWSGGDRNNCRGETNSNTNYIQHNSDYYRNTHHLYYKYFQSLTRNEQTSSKSRSRSRSKSRTQAIHDQQSRSKSSSSSRSRSFKRNSPNISRKPYRRTRSRSRNRIEPGRRRRFSYSRERFSLRNKRTFR